jgi:nitrite reductase/ring-hydroxylating ferredoxin subunit
VNRESRATREAVNRGEQYTAVSRRCRHQLADLSNGGVDAHGCLVCPWHGARYDLETGEMVSGPQGFLNYQGRTPGYSALVKAVGQVLRLRRRPAHVEGTRIVVDE